LKLLPCSRRTAKGKKQLGPAVRSMHRPALSFIYFSLLKRLVLSYNEATETAKITTDIYRIYSISVGICRVVLIGNFVALWL
jgi:hypothetical protein